MLPKLCLFPWYYILYFNLETFVVPVEDNGTTSKAVTKELLKPSGFSCLRVAQDLKYNGDNTYSGPDVMDIFNQLIKLEEFATDVLSKAVKISPLSEEEQKIHTNAKNCKLCGNCINHDKVGHHNDVTGRCIDPCSIRCNLQLKFRKGRNDEKRNSSPTNHGSRKEFCSDAHTILDNAEID